MPTLTEKANLQHILTVDVEDWFHLLEVRGGYSYAEWDHLPSRVVASTERLLELFDEHGVRATFFLIGWVAARNKDLVRRIADAGHELGSHSYWHELIARYDRAALDRDLEVSRKVIEDTSGVPVRGFRAPGFSITRDSAWAFDLILRHGFEYDSSLWPGRSSYGGFPTRWAGPFMIRAAGGDIVEIPATTRVWGIPVPYCGGGYLRLLPAPVVRGCIAANARQGIPTTLYIHPRDFDADQPRIPLSPMRRFRSYVGLAAAEQKLRALLRTFEWTSAGAWIEQNAPSIAGRILDVRDLASSTSPAPDSERIPPPPA